VSAARPFDEHDARALRRAVEIARGGAGEVEPNPQVGAVLYRGAEVLSEGFHRMYGEAHAEVEALRGRERVPAGATLAVTLEPCSASGKKTPPCVAALRRADVKRLVVGAVDPDPRHSGRGLEELAAAGVEVVRAPAGQVPEELLAGFRLHLARPRPWVVLKWACGLDGRWVGESARERKVSGEAALAEVQRLRGHVDAVLVGSGTVLRDDPRLTARPPGPRAPVRVVLDRRGRVSPTARLFGEPDAGAVFWFTSKSGAAPAGVERIALAQDGGLDAALAELRTRGVARLLVEGGPTLAAALLREGRVDQAWVFVAAALFAGGGLAGLGSGDALLARTLRPRVTSVERCGCDAWFKLAFT
jgi:diaminohydroxyphosphoribosylaminopyrimidine deaminase / 5-amino-6-(5-phosphoribosylamino)uracil reductase